MSSSPRHGRHAGAPEAVVSGASEAVASGAPAEKPSPAASASHRSDDSGGRAPTRNSYTMSLLQSLWEDTPEPDYDRVAGEPRRKLSPSRALFTVVIALVLGFAISIATIQLRTPTPEGDRARDYLLTEIDNRTESAAELGRSNAQLSSEIQGIQDKALAAGDDELLERTRRLEELSGATEVKGAGVTITIDDARGSSFDGSGPREGSSAVNTVRDSDLQTAVNGLWAAGAQGISINGQRLTGLTSIRNAGEAILVDYTPLRPPYVISAIGDPVKLQSSFARLPAASYLQSLKSNYGIRVEIAPQDDLTLPASGTLRLDSARPKNLKGSL
ncbi:DUF881 domain-containing protein [Saxibacter everestensis]|uniref:DUF881 domain-containing protein n=1 Tax=Saxibacter everestensis TaxID=2909229 RepID=A0ABY8QXV3_9MICO|nr:DUF881 domain-containing protein [Brevibacteriaceae bacterium ZFBP1038]